MVEVEDRKRSSRRMPSTRPSADIKAGSKESHALFREEGDWALSFGETYIIAPK